MPHFPALGDLFLRSPTSVLVYDNFLVVPMCLGSALCMIVVFLLTLPLPAEPPASDISQRV